MEKWSKWRDAGTGIHPFLPLLSQTAWPVQLLQLLVGAVVKLPLLLVFGSLLLCLSTVLPPHLFVLHRCVCAPLARLILALLGFYWIDSRMATLRLGRSALSADSSPSGNVVQVWLCNHCSFVDILYLYYRLTPTFIWPVLSSKGSIEQGMLQHQPPPGTNVVMGFVTVPWYRAIWRSWRGGSDIDLGNDTSQEPMALDQLLARHRRQGPLVLLPELTTSNGRGLLRAPDGLISSIIECVPVDRLGFLAIKYNPQHQSFSPAFSVGNAWYHLLLMAGQLWNSMQVFWLPSTENPLISPVESANTTSTTTSSPEDKVMDALARMLQVRRTGMSVYDKQPFQSAYYAATRSKKWQ